MFTAILTRLRALLQRRRVAREVDDELGFHLEMEIQSNVEAGMSPEDARRVALRDFGGIEQTKEAVRDVRTIWLDSFWQDVRLAFRMLGRDPAFAVVALLSLSLGIGINLSIFSFVNGLFLLPLPAVTDPGSLVSLQHRSRTTGQFTSASYPDYAYYRQHVTSFSGVVAYTSFAMTVRAGESAETIRENWSATITSRCWASTPPPDGCSMRETVCLEPTPRSS